MTAELDQDHQPLASLMRRQALAGVPLGPRTVASATFHFCPAPWPVATEVAAVRAWFEWDTYNFLPMLDQKV
jgi:hypothetical protein